MFIVLGTNDGSRRGRFMSGRNCTRRRNCTCCVGRFHNSFVGFVVGEEIKVSLFWFGFFDGGGFNCNESFGRI